MNTKNYQKLQDKYTSWNVKPYLKSGLSKIEILQLKEAFDLFDIDQKGIIDINDLKERLNEMGILSKNEEIDKLIANDNITEVDFMTFINILGAKAQCKNKEEVKKLYCVFLNDDDIERNLSVENFKRVAGELELSLAEDEIEEMIRSVNPKEDGYVSFEEFYNIMMKIEQY